MLSKHVGAAQACNAAAATVEARCTVGAVLRRRMSEFSHDFIA